MPAKISMYISNGNYAPPPQVRSAINVANIVNVANAPLNVGMIKRIHNVRPGCGSCGRKG